MLKLYVISPTLPVGRGVRPAETLNTTMSTKKFTIQLPVPRDVSDSELMTSKEIVEAIAFNTFSVASEIPHLSVFKQMQRMRPSDIYEEVLLALRMHVLSDTQLSTLNGVYRYVRLIGHLPPFTNVIK